VGDADERVAAAELRIAAIDERLAAVDDRVAAVAEREQAIAERIAAVHAREAAVAERDAIATERDRAAAARDAIANERDRAAIEREAAHRRQPTVSGNQSPDDDGQDPELERARLEAQLQRAHLDSLTGAFRREMGRLALRNEIERARRSDGRFVIAFVDVDGLKSVNDREGHAAGDKILRTLAATMRANLRSYDPIVRYGGDEFVCGIASIDTDEVQHRIGVIDQSLRSSTGVGVTAGLATLSADESLEELTARADAALLEAKRKRDAAES
jgi:diguanylate cyclase (GGDEF)-like protein